MHFVVIILCIFITALATTACTSESTTGSNMSGALTHRECERLVRRTFYNVPGLANAPGNSEVVADCVAGKRFFNRSYLDCVFAFRYSNPTNCAYAALGIDRSKKFPELASLKPGENGSFASAVSSMMSVIYGDQDPHKVIDPDTLKMYLTERDSVIRSLGQTPPADSNSPKQVLASRIDLGSQTYWTVYEDFTEVQIVRILRESSGGAEMVTCVRYGSSERLRVDRGFCASLVKEYLQTTLVDQRENRDKNRDGGS